MDRTSFFGFGRFFIFSRVINLMAREKGLIEISIIRLLLRNVLLTAFHCR